MTHVTPYGPVHPSRPIRRLSLTHVSTYPARVEQFHVTAVELDPDSETALGGADLQDAARPKGVVHDVDSHLEPRRHWGSHRQILPGLWMAVD
jgi:hypothetical protein